MSTTLVVALFVEGRVDERFLPVLIQREAESILLRHARKTVDVLEPILVEASVKTPHAERILRLAQENHGYHVLIIHSDADYPSADRALKERFFPGMGLVQRAKLAGEAVSEHIIPIIPVQMVESWMIADPKTLHAVIGTSADVADLGLPMHPYQVESIPEPKQMLLQAVTRALADRPRRRRDPQGELSTLQEPLARRIRLEELRKIPAFQQFEQKLHSALRALQLAD